QAAAEEHGDAARGAAQEARDGEQGETEEQDRSATAHVGQIADDELAAGEPDEEEAEGELCGSGADAEHAREHRLRGQAHVDREGGDRGQRGQGDDPAGGADACGEAERARRRAAIGGSRDQHPIMCRSAGTKSMARDQRCPPPWKPPPPPWKPPPPPWKPPPPPCPPPPPPCPPPPPPCPPPPCPPPPCWADATAGARATAAPMAAMMATPTRAFRSMTLAPR